MPFQVSPGVSVREIDLTTTVPAVSTNDAGMVGVFSKGPIEEIVLVENEQQLIEIFGRPSDNNYVSFLSAANFLHYGNKLRVVRVNPQSDGSGVSGKNAGTGTSSVLIKNHNHFHETIMDTDRKNDGPGFGWVARNPGALGDSLKVSIAAGPHAYANANVAFVNTAATTGATTIRLHGRKGGSVTAPGYIAAVGATSTSNEYTLEDGVIKVGDYIKFPNATYPETKYRVTAIAADDLVTGASPAMTGRELEGAANLVTFSPALVEDVAVLSSVEREWQYASYFDHAPGETVWAKGLGTLDVNVTGDEMHLVVVDTDGEISGQRDVVLEAFGGLSKAENAKDPEGGAPLYYREAVNERSNYVYWAEPEASHPDGTTTSWGARVGSGAVAFAKSPNSNSLQLNSRTGVESEKWATDADFKTALDLFRNQEEVDISVMFLANTSTTVVKHAIQNVAEVRKDFIVCISPERADVVPTGTESSAFALKRVLDFRRTQLNNMSSSYGVMDSGWKYVHDKYNNKFRWIPLSSDTAGCIIRTDNEADPWYSPAGYNRGHIKNLVKLAWSPSKGQRDDLYKNDINPVVNFPGEGTVLFGDKTMYGRNSAFDRINVRRLFIVLEKAISTAAKFLLFEFNDEFTRAQFRNMVEPFLRDVKGRRGIYDFKVVCDEANNPGSVIDRNEFVGDIYIKPARSINYIQLNFIAVSTGVSFSEVVGQAG